MTVLHVARRSRGRDGDRPRGVPVRADGAGDRRSHLLVPRADLDWMWSAHAARWRARLPDQLRWAQRLCDPTGPVAVRCAAAQARAVIVWPPHLPADARVTFTCRRLRLPPRRVCLSSTKESV